MPAGEFRGVDPDLIVRGPTDGNDASVRNSKTARSMGADDHETIPVDRWGPRGFVVHDGFHFIEAEVGAAHADEGPAPYR